MQYQYITDPKSLTAALDRLRGSSIWGVDTEAAGYHRYHDRISLIQISSEEENFLIDPCAIEDLSALAEPFEDPAIEKLFHDADFDLRILDRDLDLHVNGLFDTQIAASFAGCKSIGLSAVVGEYLGIDLPKEYQRADWAERPLSDGMKEYAVKDTAYLPELREKLKTALEKLGRLHWAEEEFEIREGTRWSEPEGQAEAFLRIKGARDLTNRGLAILREIYEWREEQGRERDQATFRVLGNQSMIELAMRAPESANQLDSIRGISTAMARRSGKQIVAAIRRGLEVPESDLPSFPPSRRWERDPEAEELTDRLRAVRTEVSGKLGLDPGFLISRAVLEDIARRRPKNTTELLEVPEVRRWQAEAIGDQILNVVRSA